MCECVCVRCVSVCVCVRCVSVCERDYVCVKQTAKCKFANALQSRVSVLE